MVSRSHGQLSIRLVECRKKWMRNFFIKTLLFTHTMERNWTIFNKLKLLKMLSKMNMKIWWHSMNLNSIIWNMEKMLSKIILNIQLSASANRIYQFLLLYKVIWNRFHWILAGRVAGEHQTINIIKTRISILLRNYERSGRKSIHLPAVTLLAIFQVQFEYCKLFMLIK